MPTSVKIHNDAPGKPVNEKLNRGMIGSLLYLIASRPDIAFSVGVCARFQSKPHDTHLKTVKRIFRYLSGTLELGLWYPAEGSMDLIGFSDSDFAGNVVDRKSTSGTCQFLGASLVSWFSKKQSSIALSTAEAEYVAAGSCCTQILWLKAQLRDFGVSLSTTPLLCDNTSAINMTKNAVYHSRTKHTDIRHHFIRDLVASKEIELTFIATESQLADIFTKPLPIDRFLFLRKSLGIISLADVATIEVRA